MSEQLTLFTVPGPAVAPAPEEMTGDQRRTERQHRIIPLGIHPLTLALDGTLRVHRDAAADGRTCGNCRFRETVNLGTQRNYPKCLSEEGPFSRTLTSGTTPSRVSRGAGTDVRRWWPGCRDHEFGDPKLSPDAARSGPSSATDE